MGRRPRSFGHGEAYHLTARGTNRQPIFADDHDRRHFLGTLRRASCARAWSCLAYCLMGNHVHLMIRAEAPAVSAGMRDLLGSYSRYFNRRHEREGHLFRARFHDVHVARDAQAVAVVRYIALNPVRAGLCDRPEAWPWSSYAAMLAPAGVADSIVDERALFALFAPFDGSRASGVAAVARFVTAGVADATARRVLSA